MQGAIMTILKLLIIGSVVLAALMLVVFFVPRNFNEEGSVGAANASIGSPVRLMIPSIRVNAPVEKKGLASDGTLDVPKGPATVAWYQYGPRPGDAGSAVITGHYGPWRTGARSVFDNLNKLRKGDIVKVQDDKGNLLSFKVREKKLLSKDAPAAEVSRIFNKNNGTHLNLITCSGTWLPRLKTYTERLVIFTDLII